MIPTRMAVAALVFFTCMIAGSCSKKSSDNILGEWTGDVDALLSDQKFKQKATRPNAAEMASRLLSSISMTITRDTVTAEVNNNKLTTRYKVLSVSDKMVIVDILDGNRRGTKTNFTIIDRNHISISDERNPATLYLKRK